MLEAVFPAEITGDAPRITLTGSQAVHIEQHKGLVTYQPEEVAFRTAAGLIRITGRGMGFRVYTAQEAVIRGEIESVVIVGNGGGRG